MRLLDDEPHVLPYPYHCGSVELEIPHPRILEATSSTISQPSLSIEPYKYKLIYMVEGRTLKVFLCCWIDHLAQAIGEHRELESELMGMRMLGFMETHVNTKAWL